MSTQSKPLALRPKEAAKSLGISTRLLYELNKSGTIPCVRIGTGKRRSVLYPVAELQDWLSKQSQRQTVMTAGGR